MGTKSEKIRDRRARVWLDRARGFSVNELARREGVCHETIRRDMKAARESALEPLDAVLLLQSEGFDVLAIAKSDDDRKTILSAIARLIDVLKTRLTLDQIADLDARLSALEEGRVGCAHEPD